MTVVAMRVGRRGGNQKRGDSGKEDYCGWWALFRN